LYIALAQGLGWETFSILPMVSTWLQVIFTCAHLKQFLGSTHNEEVKKMVKDWFNGLAADFNSAGLQKLFSRYKCLNLHGDCVEK
jgi:hypothetical protein